MSELDFSLEDAVLRRLLWAMPTGLYVLGSTGGPNGPYNLMTHSLAVQVATTPRVVAVAVERDARTHELVSASGVAALNVLRRDQRAIVRRFVKPVDDIEVGEDGRPVMMAGVDVALTPAGAPFLTSAAGCLELRVTDAVGFASHTLFCGEVTAAAAVGELLAGSAAERTAEILRMEDTRMNYGG